MYVKYTVRTLPFNTSIRMLKRHLPDALGAGMQSGMEVVAENVKARFVATTPTIEKPEVRAMYENIKASNYVYSGGSITVGVGNIPKLDEATKVITLGEGKEYHLWRLLEYGFGSKGGGDKGLYLIKPVKAKALSFYYQERLWFLSYVHHPGAAGKHFFLDMRKNWYNEDINVVKEHITKKLQEITTKFNFKE